MLPSAHRLRKTNDFKRVFKDGKGAQSDKIFLKVRSNKEGAIRIGIIVSKKVAKKAVDRNRIRRILSEGIRTHISRIKQGRDIVIVVLPGLDLQGTRDAEKITHTLFKKLALFVS
ncbi:ribonuclease P protein component [Patescibacteria group bacterium]|nr:ribonuclease P protein component [Patescibacteria group bacterium]